MVFQSDNATQRKTDLDVLLNNLNSSIMILKDYFRFVQFATNFLSFHRISVYSGHGWHFST